MSSLWTGNAAGSHLALVRMDQRRCIQGADDAFLALVGAETDQVVGQCLDAFVSVRHRKYRVDYLNALTNIAEGEMRHLIAMLGTGSSGHQPAEMRLLKRPDGWLAQVCAIVDGHVLQPAMLGLERWQAVLRNSNFGIAVLDADGQLVDSNLALLDLVDLRSGDGVLLSTDGVRGRPFFELVGSPSFDPVKEALTARRARKRRFDGVLSHGNRVLHVTMTPLLSAGSDFSGVCILVSDKTTEEASTRLRTEMARLAGMSEVATGVLHNVGNVVNSVNVSAGSIQSNVRGSSIGLLTKVVGLLEAHAGDPASLCAFLSEDKRGKRVIESILLITEKLEAEHGRVQEDVVALQDQVAHIMAIVTHQQQFASSAEVLEEIEVGAFLDRAISMSGVTTSAALIRWDRRYGETPIVEVDTHKLMQIVVNLITNARHALLDHEIPDPVIAIVAERAPGSGVRISVSDNGVGIPEELLTKIFEHGFTTKAEGHGFGLHSCATHAMELGAELRAYSDGLGTGATFELIVPARRVSPSC